MKPLRYLAVGALCAGLNNAILIAGAVLGLHFAVSLALSFATVVVVGYFAHSQVTFGEPRSRTGFGRYVAAMLVNLPLSFVLLAGCEALHLPMIVAAPATTAITLACNYGSSRWAIVRRPTNAADPTG